MWVPGGKCNCENLKIIKGPVLRGSIIDIPLLAQEAWLGLAKAEVAEVPAPFW